MGDFYTVILCGDSFMVTDPHGHIIAGAVDEEIAKRIAARYNRPPDTEEPVVDTGSR